MSRTTEKLHTAASPQRNKARSDRARRRSMSAALSALEEGIVSILQQAPTEGLTLPDLVTRLREAGFPSADTAQVRSAVWQLIHKRKADLTPRRLVTAVAS
jgi:hypothetical protein